MDPEGQFEMTSVNDPAKSPAASQRAGANQTISSTTPPSTRSAAPEVAEA
jgi:hypothetical protein